MHELTSLTLYGLNNDYYVSIVSKNVHLVVGLGNTCYNKQKHDRLQLTFHCNVLKYCVAPHAYLLHVLILP
jgi:hypothetical protein